MKQATVSAGLTRSILDYATDQGADRAALLAAAEIAENALADQDARVPFGAYLRLIRTAAQLTGDPALSLNHALNTRIDSQSVVGLIVHSSASVADAMNQLNRYAKLMVEVDVMETGERFSVEAGPDGVWIVDNRPDPNASPEITEGAFGTFIGEFRREFPDNPFALQIEVTHAAPAHAEDYARLLGCPVSFGARRNALQIAPRWLTQTFDETSRYVFGIFTERADALLAELEQAESLRGRIEALLLPRLHKGMIAIDAVAAELGMSRATLYRRLKDEGLTFAELVDGLRARLASDYLAARKVSVNETAYLVGFSEASSFVRAFRRWTGKTPAEYRAGLLAG
ncbi:AraC family transcriptional regulator [Devosia sp.]|uniref:AraC family transcriptional regulator n=1 Tax=Devosia sp. TaxID=1871048 RepID=UPI003A937F75